MFVVGVFGVLTEEEMFTMLKVSGLHRLTWESDNNADRRLLTVCVQ